MAEHYDFSQHKINLGDTNYPQKHNAAMDALEQLGNDTLQRAQEAAHHAAIAAKRVMTKPEFDTIRQNEIRNLLGAGFKKTDFDNDYEFAQVDGWQNKLKIKANEIVIDGLWHHFNDTMIQLHEAPNGLQNIDLAQPDFADIDAAIAAGGTSLSKSYLRQREIVIAIQEDIAVSAANATSMAYIQDANNHVYSVDGQLRQRVLSFVVERLPVSVPMASKHFAYGDARNAMSALGWTETDITGQWKKGGKIGVALIWVERLNQGGGHPINPDGCRKFNEVGTWSNGSWHNQGKYRPSSICDCFLIKNGDPSNGDDRGAYVNSGTIVRNSSGRWNGDGKLYDAIYLSETRDLRLNACGIPDSEVLNVEMTKAITGKYKGFESLPFIPIAKPSTSTFSHNGGATYMHSGVLRGVASDRGGVFVGASNSLVQSVDIKKACIAVSQGGAGEYAYLSDGTNTFRIQSWFNQHNLRITKLLNGEYVDGEYQYELEGNSYLFIPPPSVKITVKAVASAEQTWTDLIGTPVNVAETVKNLSIDGLYATWIGAGNNQRQKLSRKSTESQGVQIYTSDNGLSFSSSIVAINTLSNDRTGVGAGLVVFVNYRTKNHFTEKNSNSDTAIRGEIFSSSDHRPEYGNTLISSLIAKVPTVSAANSKINLILQEYTLDGDKFHVDPRVAPSHNPIWLAGEGPAAKVLFSVTNIEGIKAVQLHYKEMIFDDGTNSTNDFTHIAPSTTTKTAGQFLFVNDGAFQGYWEWLKTTTTPLTHSSWFERAGELFSVYDQAVFARRWNGNGWGDDNKFQITDGVSTILDENNNSVKFGTHIFVTNVPAEKQHDS